jgi:serine phosphatase RsbU (regulator of sigma subunit)
MQDRLAEQMRRTEELKAELSAALRSQPQGEQTDSEEADVLRQEVRRLQEALADQQNAQRQVADDLARMRRRAADLEVHLSLPSRISSARSLPLTSPQAKLIEKEAELHKAALQSAAHAPPTANGGATSDPSWQAKYASLSSRLEVRHDCDMRFFFVSLNEWRESYECRI